MKNNLRIILFVCSLTFCLFIFNTANAQSNAIRINEFMALNQTTIADEDGDYSDWIELYNPTSSTVNILGWSLTDDIEQTQKWIFPDVSIPSKSCLLVFASGKNKTNTSGTLHTNFKLSGSGEFLALYNNENVVLSKFDPAYPAQEADVSYGFYENTYIGIANPSPGTNDSGSIDAILSAPVFNKAHGFYESPFNLTISSEYPSAKIYYTNDGSDPSASNGTLYSSPISIETTSVIRAIAIATGSASSKITTRTFLFLDDVVHQSNIPEGYPAEWGSFGDGEGNAPADYEMDPELVSDLVYANKVKEALKDLPTISLVTNKEHLFNPTSNSTTGGIYMYTSSSWERPVSFEYFDNDTVSFQVDCGVRIQGGQGRVPKKNPKHSFRLVFRGDYGPTKLNYPFFGEDALAEINSITLRAGFCNSWTHHSSEQRDRAQYIRDTWSKNTQLAMGHPGAHSNFAHLYINGLYWGLYSPTERMDDDFGEAYFEGDAEDFDVIKDYSEAVEGNTTAWNKMMALANAGLETTEAYQKIQGNNPDGTPNANYENLVDVVNLADYMLINLYNGNTDWDKHNWAAIRNREKRDKGFKFICWDQEHILENLSDNNVKENNDKCPSRVFQKLVENEDFQHLFADRVLLHCYNNGALTENGAKEEWVKLSKIVEKSMNAEAARWGDYRRDVHPYQTDGPFALYTKETHWLPQQDFLLNEYFPQRTQILIEQLRAAGLYPNVDGPSFFINDELVINSVVTNGDLLSMSAADGEIYYTTDGSDPVLWEIENEKLEIKLIENNTDKRVLVPKSDQGTTWLSDISMDDSSWGLCTGSPGGVGYEKSSDIDQYITFDVANEMHSDDTANPNTSCYIRIPFTVNADDLPIIKSLILNIRYDDGFIAYLNGTEVASQNVVKPIAWNSNNSNNHEGDSEESINISSSISSLKVGENLLAIQGVNMSTTSSDFVILPSLIASDESAKGNASPTASVYAQNITVNNSLHVKARVLFNGEWSAMMDKFLLIPSDFNNLKITEVNYNPHPKDNVDGDNFEFVELKNTGSSILNLQGLKFDEGIDYEFKETAEIKPGEFVVLADNSDYFYDRYGFLPYDNYGGQLDNSGERISILGLVNDTICSFKYNDNNAWPQSPDGLGYSLVSSNYNPTTSQDSSIYWRASYEMGGSPGADDIAGIVMIDAADTSTTIISEPIITPPDNNVSVNLTADVELDDCEIYPNPFSDFTQIQYYLPTEARVKISVHNIMGQIISSITDEVQYSGSHTITWDMSNKSFSIPDGLYFYKLEVQTEQKNTVIIKKMIKITR